MTVAEGGAFYARTPFSWRIWGALGFGGRRIPERDDDSAPAEGFVPGALGTTTV